MSLRCMTWVFTESTADGFDRLVLLAIADEADDDGTGAYPSWQRIAAKAHVSKRSVQRCIEQLEKDGELLVDRPVEKGRGHVWNYTVTMGRTPEQIQEGRAARLFSVDPRRARKGAERRAVLPKSRQTQNPVLLNSERTAKAAAALRERHTEPDCKAGCASGWMLEDGIAKPCPVCGQDAEETASA